MKKVRSLSPKRIDEISALIGASFWDFPYEPGEGGLKPFFPSKSAMTEYMKSFVIAGIESGTFYSTDRWGKEYASFSQQLCEDNSDAEGVQNTEFRQGDACRLNFPDEYFDAVTSNYVYHNITGTDKQALLRETLRVLKKGGTFAIHDIMSKARYGDMQQFISELYDEGYEVVELIETANGMFMSKCEAKILGLSGSSLLIGRK